MELNCEARVDEEVLITITYQLNSFENVRDIKIPHHCP